MTPNHTTHETLVTRLNVSNLIKQILTFYNKSNFVLFSISAKIKLDFIKFNFAFLFQFYSLNSHPYCLHSHPESRHSHSDSLHSRPDSLDSHPDSPHSYPNPHILCISRIPTPIPCITITILCIPLISFPNSSFRLLQIADSLLSIVTPSNFSLLLLFIFSPPIEISLSSLVGISR